MQTHQISINESRLTKTFRSWDRGEHYREWQALTHLAHWAPDLSPVPVEPQLERDPPSVVMSVLPGESLQGRWTPDQLAALEVTHRRLWSVPVSGMDPIPSRPAEDPTFWRGLFDDQQRPPAGIVREAFDTAVSWLASDAVLAVADETDLPVLGQGDPNQANFLWDGRTIRIVDFEDAGRSELTYELANLVEHLANRDAGFEVLLDRFDVAPRRLLLCRQLISCFWLQLLLPGRPAAHRNPPETLDSQARRCLALLGQTR